MIEKQRGKDSVERETSPGHGTQKNGSQFKESQ